jgi:hypothetical protein
MRDDQWSTAASGLIDRPGDDRRVVDRATRAHDDGWRMGSSGHHG